MKSSWNISLEATVSAGLYPKLKESLPLREDCVRKISSSKRDASLIWESICGKCPESIIAHFYVWSEVLAWGMTGINDPLCRKRQSPGFIYVLAILYHYLQLMERADKWIFFLPTINRNISSCITAREAGDRSGLFMPVSNSVANER